ncbi:ComF family protein [Arenivirga flava]|uniref:ComF family protein n=1 Tax=Arenivirga flava TaxID=1930060 RepID=A0AA37UDX7_9MICO|nr:ComF family protein [Arenivirga flava]GMA27970.1 hypothetical protein GCM10025874_12230 [Arenivirga flava]
MPLPPILTEALAVVLPDRCAGCGRDGAVLCPGCSSSLRGLRPAVVVPRHGGPVHAAWPYEGAARAALLAFKESGRTDLATPLAAALAGALRAALPDGGRPIAVVPVPPSPAGDRRRGYRPVELLLRRAGLRPTRLLRTRGEGGAQQKTLDRVGRAAAREGAFRVVRAEERMRDRDAILVDDVGASLAAAQAELEAAGARVLGRAVLCATAERIPRTSAPEGW